MQGFIKLWRASEELDFLNRRPNALALLVLIARRARRQPGIDPRTGIYLDAGEALIGDCETSGLTPRSYRTAKKHLKTTGQVTFRATSRGTVAKLVKTNTFDINADDSDKQTDEQSDEQGTSEGQASDKQATTNKEVKKDKKEKKEKETTTVVAIFSDCFQQNPSQTLVQELNALVEECGLDLVRESFTAASAQGKPYSWARGRIKKIAAEQAASPPIWNGYGEPDQSTSWNKPGGTLPDGRRVK